MEKSAVGKNKTDDNNNKQQRRRQRIEINGGGGFAGILLLGGVAFTAAALVAATTFAKNNNHSNNRRKSNKKQEEESTAAAAATSSRNIIQKFDQGRNDLGLLSVLHLVPSSSPEEEESSQLCSNRSNSVIGFGATTRSKIVMSSPDDEIDAANKSFLPCEEEEEGNLLNDNTSSVDRVSIDNSFVGKSTYIINMGLVIDQESLKREEDDNDNNADEYKEDNDSGDCEFENDEDESIEDKGEEDSEGTGDSSRESNAEAIWPQELIEGDNNLLEMKEMKIHSLLTEANKAVEVLAREEDTEKESLGIHQQNERETGLTMANHLIESKSRLWLWSTLAMGLLLLVIHSLLLNIFSSTL